MAHELRPVQAVVHDAPPHAIPALHALTPPQQTVVCDARLVIAPPQELTPLQLMSHEPEPAQAMGPGQAPVPAQSTVHELAPVQSTPPAHPLTPHET
jgi:hypothetical protein